MGEYPRARLAFITEPSPGEYVLNVQVKPSDELIRVEISRNQLGNMVAMGAKALLQSRSDDG